MRAFLFALALLPVAINAFLPGDESEYYDILGTGRNEYRLAFRGQAGIKTSMYDAYTHGSVNTYNFDDACKGTNWSLPCNSHYRNDDALDNWVNTQEILLGIVDENALVKILRFRGKDTTYLNWMHKDYLFDDCWEDLMEQPTNYFGIEGHGAIRRRFFINRNYGGCSKDAGWLVVADQANPNCPWEKNQPWPYIKYVAGQTYENWNEQMSRSAQALVVFIRYSPGEEKEYFDLFNTGLKEWRFAFRGTARVGQPVYPAYIGGPGIYPSMQPECMTIDFTKTCTSHYRNDHALDNWHRIELVLLGIVHKGQMIKTLFFNGRETTYQNWMEPKYYNKSCWEDLKFGPHNYFSILGDDKNNRRFFLNRNYGGCDNDAGWLVAIDTPPKPCSWQVSAQYPVFKFAPGPHYENWSKGTVLEADAIVIFLKYY